ncbi:MAG: IS200/IS605 family transposase [Bacteroidia bacterium]
MPQSLSQLYIHLIFGTKHREPFIKDTIEIELHAFLIGTLKKYDCKVIAINSVSDHVHILFRMSKNHALSKVVEELKKQSSKWMKEKGIEAFFWQIGYGAFSVSPSKLQAVIQYIRKQKEHHQHHSFQDEMEVFMTEYGVTEYDAKFFWNE